MKLFHYSVNRNFAKVQRASTRPSISLIVLLLATILIIPSFASAEIRKEHYRSGKLRSEANVVNGNLEGIAKGYYESGGIAYIDTYKNGKKINRKAYTEKGKLEFDQDYPQ